MDANAAFDAIQKIARSSKNLADLESMKARARAVIDQFKHRTRGLPLSRKSGSSASTSTEHARPGGSTRWRPRFSWRRVIGWPAPAGFTAQRPAAPRRPHHTASNSHRAAGRAVRAISASGSAIFTVPRRRRSADRSVYLTPGLSLGAFKYALKKIAPKKSDRYLAAGVGRGAQNARRDPRVPRVLFRVRQRWLGCGIPAPSVLALRC
jgi:hypothetical protein